MLALQNDPDAVLDLAGLSSRVEPVAVTSAKFDLSFDLAEQRAADGTPAGIDGWVEYATDLFDRATSSRLSGRLVRLLEAVVAEPEQAIGRLDILSADERDTILPGLERYGALGSGRHRAGAVRRAGGAARPRRPPWCSGSRASATRISTGAPTGWRITCAASASVPRWWWGCAWSARPR